MINNELIADKIEEVIKEMCMEFGAIEPKTSEYLILHNPKKQASWFIVIFFANINQLKDGLKNGVCYQIHSYILDNLNKIDDISNIDRTIFFESGNRPIEKKDIESLFGKLVNKMEGLQKDTGKTNLQICGGCGHNFDNHQLMCYRKDEDSAPTEGWMICPEENCNCFQTWSANYKDLKVENRKENRFKRVFKNLFK